MGIGTKYRIIKRFILNRQSPDPVSVPCLGARWVRDGRPLGLEPSGFQACRCPPEPVPRSLTGRGLHWGVHFGDIMAIEHMCQYFCQTTAATGAHCAAPRPLRAHLRLGLGSVLRTQCLRRILGGPRDPNPGPAPCLTAPGSKPYGVLSSKLLQPSTPTLFQ